MATVAQRAGGAIKAIARDALAVQTKGDGSPVTSADFAANEVICAGLSAAFPSWTTISEETAPASKTDAKSPVFLIDPLDGTREYMRGSDQFTVNIALLEAGIPVAGIIYAPALGVMYGGMVGHSACRANVHADVPGEWQVIRAVAPPGPLRALTSYSHVTRETREFLQDYAIGSTRAVGSSVKFCWIAEGGADIYPRLGRTMQWDTAAGDAILRAAGGRVTALDGKPLTYLTPPAAGCRPYENPWFVAAGAFDPLDPRRRTDGQAAGG
jgi:3'(2'),5'-bisphosphate nucleotidase